MSDYAIVFLLYVIALILSARWMLDGKHLHTFFSSILITIITPIVFFQVRTNYPATFFSEVFTLQRSYDLSVGKTIPFITLMLCAFIVQIVSGLHKRSIFNVIVNIQLLLFCFLLECKNLVIAFLLIELVHLIDVFCITHGKKKHLWNDREEQAKYLKRSGISTVLFLCGTCLHFISTQSVDLSVVISSDFQNIKNGLNLIFYFASYISFLVVLIINLAQIPFNSTIHCFDKNNYSGAMLISMLFRTTALTTFSMFLVKTMITNLHVFPHRFLMYSNTLIIVVCSLSVLYVIVSLLINRSIANLLDMGLVANFSFSLAGFISTLPQNNFSLQVAMLILSLLAYSGSVYLLGSFKQDLTANIVKSQKSIFESNRMLTISLILLIATLFAFPGSSLFFARLNYYSSLTMTTVASNFIIVLYWPLSLVIMLGTIMSLFVSNENVYEAREENDFESNKSFTLKRLEESFIRTNKFFIACAIFGLHVIYYIFEYIWI